MWHEATCARCIDYVGDSPPNKRKTKKTKQSRQSTLNWHWIYKFQRILIWTKWLDALHRWHNVIFVTQAKGSPEAIDKGCHKCGKLCLVQSSVVINIKEAWNKSSSSASSSSHLRFQHSKFQTWHWEQGGKLLHHLEMRQSPGLGQIWASAWWQ